MVSEGPHTWLVTAGPTREDIDPVRFISNRSSGRMGYAIARAAVESGKARGDSVILVSGPVALEAPEGCEIVRVRSAAEMQEAVNSRFESVDIVVMAAAVADFRVAERSALKIKRTGERLVLELEPTDDILAGLGRRKRERRSAQVLVGFALEAPEQEAGAAGISSTMRALAERKLAAKNLDAIALNGPGAIDAERSTLAVLVRQARDGAEGDTGWQDWGEGSKEDHARRLVELAEELVRRAR